MVVGLRNVLCGAISRVAKRVGLCHVAGMVTRRQTPAKKPQAAKPTARQGRAKGTRSVVSGGARGAGGVAVDTDHRPGIGVLGNGHGHPELQNPGARWGAGGRGLASDMYDPAMLAASEGFKMGQGRGLSPIVDVLRGLGNESAGVFARPPRKLGNSELAAIGQDGIGRRVVTIKVEQALAPGYAIDLTGLDPTVAQEVIAEATKVFRRIHGAEHILAAGVRAQWFGRAIGVTTYLADNGLADLTSPLVDVAVPSPGNGIRWMSEWDGRDYRVRQLAPSTSIHYRQGEGATWIDLYPINGVLEYDRLYGGGGVRAGSDPSVVSVHPSRYCQLTTTTGFSVFQECAVYIANLLAAASGSASLMQRAAAGVISIEDWETQSLAGADEARQKLQAQYEALSHLNLWILAKGETFTWADLSTSGIEQGIYAIAYLLSAATGIPMTILLGTSPGAFVSGDQQIKQWHQELDRTRAWLEPMIRFVWDQCIAEATGGYVGDYSIVWNPYETPTQDEQLATMGQALDLALKAMGANLLSRETVLAGLSRTGALGFDWGAALAAVKDGNGPRSAGLDPSLFTTLTGALTGYYTAQGLPGIPQTTLAMLVSMLSPELAAAAPTLVQPPPPPPPPPPPTASAGVGVDGSGVDAAGGVVGPVAPKNPGDPLTPEDVMNADAWVSGDEAGSIFSLSAQSLKSLCTENPGVMAGPGEIAWLQNPASGHRRFRRVDLAKVMIGGRAAVLAAAGPPIPVDVVAGDAGVAGSGAGADLAYEGWPDAGIPWRMVRQADETGISGEGQVVRGLMLPGGVCVSWWTVVGSPPRPHVDGGWREFWLIHISQHPSNGTLVEQSTADGAWVLVSNLERGPGPWCDPGHECWPGDGCAAMGAPSDAIQQTMDTPRGTVVVVTGSGSGGEGVS